VELVVVLDYPRPSADLQRERRDAARHVSRRSIIVWHFATFRARPDQIRRWLADPPAPQVVRLTSEAETERWLEGLAAA
jgi:hypothetical protein